MVKWFHFVSGNTDSGAEQEGLDPQSWIRNKKSSELSLLEHISSQ